jgi:hypothetical protein
MAARGGGFAESYAIEGLRGNTCRKPVADPADEVAMQVNDCPAVPPPGTAGKEEVRSVADPGTGDARPRAGQGFRKALERGRRDPAAGGIDDGASAAALAGWFRSESAAAPAVARAAGVAGVAASRAVDRVLIGSGPDGAEARIRIGAGALAGTEIHLSSVSGQAVEARLLTHAASSRQTLSVVMDEIRSRLRDKGIVLATRAAGARSPTPAGEVVVAEGASATPGSGARTGSGP